MKLYRCMHDIELMCHEQGRQLWHFLCPRLFDRPYVPLSCPGHYSKTLWNIFMKLHRCIHHNKTMCHEQGRELLHFWFLNYFPLTRFHIVNRVRAITPKLYPRLFEEYEKGIKYYPVRPVRSSVCPSVRLSIRPSVRPHVPLRVRAITPKPYGIYSGNFMRACIPLIRCVCPSVRPTSCPGHNS